MKVKKQRLKHASCPGCTCLVVAPGVVRVSDWRHGGLLYCRKKKSGEEYNSRLSRRHFDVMGYLYEHPGTPDHELVFHFQTSHQLAVMRCVLRDAGVVEAVGETLINGKHHVLWALNKEGRRIWRSLAS